MRMFFKPRSMAAMLRRCSFALPLSLVAMVANADLIFKGDFETGKIASPSTNPDGFWVNKCRDGCDDDVGIRTNVVRSGSYSAGCTIYKSKDYTIMTNGLLKPDKPRCDVVKGAINFEYNKDYWIGFSVFLPKDWINDYEKNPDTLAQVHGTAGGPPIIELQIDQGDWLIKNRWDSTSEKMIYGESTLRYLLKKSTANDKGKWTDFVYHFRLCHEVGCDGLIEIWKNGERVVNFTGPNALKWPSSGEGPIFQVDLYKYWWKKNDSKVPSKRTVYWDEIRIGDSNSNFTEVSPPGASYSFAPDLAPPAPPEFFD